MLQTSSFNQTHVLVASNRDFSCLLGGENIYNYLIKCLPVLIILLNSLPVLVASVKDTPGELSFTDSFIINTFPLVGCLENSARKVKQFRVYPRLLQVVLFTVRRCPICECIWFCNVTPDMYRETTCITQVTGHLATRKFRHQAKSPRHQP